MKTLVLLSVLCVGSLCVAEQSAAETYGSPDPELYGENIADDSNEQEEIITKQEQKSDDFDPNVPEETEFGDLEDKEDDEDDTSEYINQFLKDILQKDEESFKDYQIEDNRSDQKEQKEVIENEETVQDLIQEDSPVDSNDDNEDAYDYEWSDESDDTAEALPESNDGQSQEDIDQQTQDIKKNMLQEYFDELNNNVLEQNKSLPIQNDKNSLENTNLQEDGVIKEIIDDNGLNDTDKNLEDIIAEDSIATGNLTNLDGTEIFDILDNVQENINENEEAIESNNDMAEENLNDTDENLEDIMAEEPIFTANLTDLDLISEIQKVVAESESDDLDRIEISQNNDVQENASDNEEMVQNNDMDENDSVPKEDLVENEHQDLDSDLNQLFDTWNTLNSNDEEEVPEVFKDLANAINDDDDNDNQDVIEVDENDQNNETFDDVDFETLFRNAKENSFEAKDDINDNHDEPKQHSVLNLEDDSDDNPAFDEDVHKALKDELEKVFNATIDYEETDEEAIEDKPEQDDKLNVDNLTSSELEVVMEQFKQAHAEDFESDKLLDTTASEPTVIHLNETDVTTITSPNYPNPYPTNQIVDWLIEGEGMGIELNITDFVVNGALGDYLLFKPGGVDASGDQGIILSYHINHERKFRFSNVNKMFVRFEAKQGMAFRRGFSFNAKMIFLPQNDTDTETIPQPETLLPAPHHTLTVNLGGIHYQNFGTIKEDFRRLLADMATWYINENGIETENDTLSITQLTSTNYCNINWPGFENCVAVTFSIPVVHSPDDADSWRLNPDDLRAMWYTYIYMDPFASRLKAMGIEEFHVPDERAVLSWWLAASALAVVLVAAGAFLLWKFSCMEDYTRMRVYTDTDSVCSKRPLELYPTPHQTLPPLSGMNYSWDEKHPDTTVNMGGYNNATFAQDDLLDFATEEPNTRDRYTTDV